MLHWPWGWGVGSAINSEMHVLDNSIEGFVLPKKTAPELST